MKFASYILFFFYLPCFGQELQDFSRLDIFSNRIEQQLFANLQSGQRIDYLSLFLVSDGNASRNNLLQEAQERIRGFTGSGDVNKLRQGANAKALKKLYKSIHDEFLSKYSENPSFGELFETGTYNCATASALYVLILDELSIKYSIRETPTHVYLVVSPGENDIVFETTTPGMATLVINEKTKEQYVEYLYSNKIISKEEWTTKDHEQLFREHFYPDKTVNSKELAGIIYYNRGVADMMKEKYKSAYANFEKAFYLYPHEKMRYFVSASIALYLVNAGDDDEERQADYYIRFAQIGNKELGSKMLLEHVDESAQKFLFKNPDPAKYRRIYQRMISGISDTAMIKGMKEVHYYHTAHFFEIKNQHDSSAIYLDSVYALNKSNLLVQELITSASANYLQSLAETEHAVDTVIWYFKKYPFLESNGRLKEFYVYCLTKEIARYYQKDKNKEAAIYVDMMKVVLEKEPVLAKKTRDYITGAVLEMYYSYVRTKKYKDGKAFLQYADKYLPGNDEITRRLKRIDEIIANQ